MSVELPRVYNLPSDPPRLPTLWPSAGFRSWPSFSQLSEHFKLLALAFSPCSALFPRVGAQWCTPLGVEKLVINFPAHKNPCLVPSNSGGALPSFWLTSP